MSFANNLQHLRSTRNMTQEQLAMLVGVSRQSVTKWETERAYPEMDKLIKISEIFDCTLDDLVSGDLTAREPEPELSPTPALADVTGYDEYKRNVARRIALGVFCIIFGVAVSCLIAVDGGSDAQNAPALVAVLMGVAAGLVLIIPTAFQIAAFRKAHPFVEDFYTAEDRTKAKMALGYEITAGVVLILAGICVMAFVQTRLGVAIMLALIALGVGVIVHGGIYGSRTDVEDYNIDALSELTEEEVASIVGEDRAASVLAKVRNSRTYGSICGIIMLLATIVGLTLMFWGTYSGNGFLSSYFWMSWMIGGMLCAIVGIVQSMNRK